MSKNKKVSKEDIIKEIQEMKDILKKIQEIRKEIKEIKQLLFPQKIVVEKKEELSFPEIPIAWFPNSIEDFTWDSCNFT